MRPGRIRHRGIHRPEEELGSASRALKWFRVFFFFGKPHECAQMRTDGPFVTGQDGKDGTFSAQRRKDLGQKDGDANRTNFPELNRNRATGGTKRKCKTEP